MKKIENAVIQNLNWFLHSGILALDGEWGVGERVVASQNNEKLAEIQNAFPACSVFKDHILVEQRRADCNFQTAFLFLLAGKYFGDKNCTLLGNNILDFLFFRSGLLQRSPKPFQYGSWNWSHIRRESQVYFDDNSWCLFLMLEIARMFPKLEARYELRKWSGILADELEKGFTGAQEQAKSTPDAHSWNGPDGNWLGRVTSPHFGGLVCMALARAGKAFAPSVTAYMQFMENKMDTFSTSELAYAILGAQAAAVYGMQENTLARTLGEKLLAKQLPTGSFPAEHHEAPIGKNLVDTIYTANWALLALQTLSKSMPKADLAKNALRDLLISIQDKTRTPCFRGCWRGMYDLDAKTWGGGDRYEGGANSIYTGWTNAPISIALLNELQDRSLFA